MKKLLWKELREKWIWLTPLSASVIVPILFGDRYYFLGDVQTPWQMLSFCTALVFGASAYSSELAGGTADFVYSRPVSWKKLLAAKLIVSVEILLMTTIMAACIYRSVCPEQYIRFAGLSHMAKGVGIATLSMGAGYLLGFLCSVVLPGMFGGLLVLIVVLISGALEFMIYDQLKVNPASLWSIYFRFIGSAVATLLIARFGLTLPTNRRVMKYFGIVFVFVLISMPLNFILKYDPFGDNGPSRIYRMSDNGQYVVMENIEDGSKLPPFYLVRIKDGKKLCISSISYMSRTAWYNGNLATIARTDLRAGKSENILWMGCMDESGHLRHTNLLLGRSTRSDIIPSSSGKHIMLNVHSCDGHRLIFADLENLRPLSTTISGVKKYWWQTDTEVGYLDLNDVRHTVCIAK